MVELDPDFFTEDNRMQDDVRTVLLRVTDDVYASLADKGFVLYPQFVILTGSLTGPDWDEHSDIDLHFGTGFDLLDKPELMREFLSLTAREFNSRDYTLLNRKLEIYFQDVEEPHLTPGVYDILGDHWLKIPDGIRVQPSQEAQEAAVDYKVRASDLVKQYDRMDRRKAESFLATITSVWQSIRNMRKEALDREGMHGLGNQIFKLLRRNSTLQTLADLIKRVKNDVYEVFR
jgi:hypothetical protein